MNSTRDLKLDGHARVHVGNNYSTVHSHADNSETIEKTRREFLQRLYTSPYKDRKNRNPMRTEGTCEWFTAHGLFQEWQEKASALLWVSADPGCGKSVLAKYLIDEILPSSDTRTTCYFFFKDDFDDQKALEGALCCILHQLFIQKPALLLPDFLDDFRVEGNQLFASFDKLWSIFTEAAKHQEHGQIVCVLDALDECVDIKPLATALTKAYSQAEHVPNLKFLVTSRPYLQIQRYFQTLKEIQPTIHLSGENQEEMDKIEQEIIISIHQRTEELCKASQFTMEERQILQDELSVVKNRTYLWVHLVFEVLGDVVFLPKDELRAKIRDLPHTVEDAYEKILRKSTDPTMARKILNIIVAAERPLNLKEMATALTFKRELHNSEGDLQRDLPMLDRLQIAIREACGLFVSVQDSQVFLIHQTAREFLLSPHSTRSTICSIAPAWQNSFILEESHRLLAGICIGYLLLDDFNGVSSSNIEISPGERRSLRDDHFFFTDYAAKNWTDHYRKAHEPSNIKSELEALRLCQAKTNTCTSWLRFRDNGQPRKLRLHKELETSLMVTSYFGLDYLVSVVLGREKASLNARSKDKRRSALSWASERGHSVVVKLLLSQIPKHQVILRRWSPYPTIVNQTDVDGKTPLWYAAAYGHRRIVKLLLKRGANVDARDAQGLTPLSCAIFCGHEDIEVLLLEKGASQNTTRYEKSLSSLSPLARAARTGNQYALKLLLSQGADIEASDKNGCTPLIHASISGSDSAMQVLLNQGANIEASDNFSNTALIWASYKGHYNIIELLLDRGANIEASNNVSSTALLYASDNGYCDIIGLLLDRGANIESLDNFSNTALILASVGGHLETVKLLLDRGANIEASTNASDTALILASVGGHLETVKLLLDRGANIEASNNASNTALILASVGGHLETVKLLLDRGANIEASNNASDTALLFASNNSYHDIIGLLLDRGADIEASNGLGVTALILASAGGHLETVKLLLDRGANIEASYDEGQTSLVWASRNGHTGVKELLLDRGAMEHA